jgi:hypothetical protein
MPKKILLFITLAALLAACLPSQQPAANVQDQVNTAVAGTMQANQQIERAVEQTVIAKEAAANPSDAPTEVPVIEVVLQASNTPVVVASFTPTATPIPLKYTCAIVNLKPRNGTTYRGGEEFQVKFNVINTGTRPWPIGIDVKYVSGTNLTGTKRVEIPKALDPGQVYLINLDGKAPKKSGYYMMTWLVDGPMCYGSIGINVK